MLRKDPGGTKTGAGNLLLELIVALIQVIEVEIVRND